MAKKILILAVFLLSIISNAQEVFHQNITVSNGLPSNTVFDIFQDSKGFIWFATDEGIARYDGAIFKTFRTKDNLLKTGSTIKEDSFGRIWFESFDGYLQYIENEHIYSFAQKKPLGFANYSFSDKYIFYLHYNGFEIVDLKSLKPIKNITFPKNFVPDFLDYKNNKVYFTKNTQAIGVYDFKNLTIIPCFSDINIASPLYASTPKGIFQTDKLDQFLYINKIEGTKITSLFKIDKPFTINNFYFLKNKFWLCTNKGLVVLDKNGNKIQEKPYFENYSISSVFIDKNNQIWVGTLNEGIFKILNFDEIEIDLKNIKPLTINIDSQKIIVGNENGNFYLLDSDFKSIKKTRFSANNQIIYLNTKHPKYNFIAADGFYITDKNFRTLKHNTIAVKSVDFVNDDKILVATSGFSGFLDLDNNKKQFENINYKDHYFKIVDNIRGKDVFWNKTTQETLLSTNLGLFSYQNNTTTELKWNGKMLNIKSIKKQNNTIYLLSSEGVLYSYKNQKIKKLLDDKFEFSMLKSIENKLYLIQNNLVYQLKNNQLELISSINCNEKIVCFDADNNYYYILLKEKLIRFPKYETTKNNQKPVLLIEKFWADTKDYTNQQKIKLNYDQNNIKIELSLIQFDKRKNIFYKINNGSWKEIFNNGNILELVQLQPNNYKIQFSNKKNGVVLKEIQFEISKPFWQQFWFILLAIITLPIILIFLYNKRLQNISQKNLLIVEKLKLENHLNESKVKLIKAQMNPHFFFNALNTIQSYITTNETEEATSYLNKFSRLTRMILEMTDKNWITIEDELKMQTLYLELQKVRLNNFDFEIQLENQNLKNALIPTMLLQPYIENAIIHGLAHKLGSKHLQIFFKNENNLLNIVILDNGIGIKKASAINQKNASKSTSFATKATLERVEIINRNECKISIEINEVFDKNQESQGTEVKITMNLRNEL